MSEIDLNAVEPGDTLIFNFRGGVVSARVWPTIRGLVVEGGDHRLLSEIDPSDAVAVKRRRKASKRARPLPGADDLSDFRPNLDRVIRVGARHFTVSADDTFAAIEVDEPPVSVFVSNYPKAVAKGWDATRQFAAVQATPYLSEEGRKERLDFLLSTGEVRLSFTITA